MEGAEDDPQPAGTGLHFHARAFVSQHIASFLLSFSLTHLTHPFKPRDMYFPVTPDVLQKSRPKDT